MIPGEQLVKGCEAVSVCELSVLVRTEKKNRKKLLFVTLQGQRHNSITFPLHVASSQAAQMV